MVIPIILMTFSFSASAEKNVEPSRAAWMEGGWGVRILLPGGDREEHRSFEIEGFVAQIKQLDSISWVMLNVTQGACGSLYTAPHPELEKHGHPTQIVKQPPSWEGNTSMIRTRVPSHGRLPLARMQTILLLWLITSLDNC